MLPPGSTMIGIVGGGQLGRMMAIAAAQLGYPCHVFDPHEAPCAAEVAAHFTRGRFDDEAALRAFADRCDVVTYEFENLAVEPLKVLGDKLRPGTRSLQFGQDRVLEKQFIESVGGRPAPWRAVDTAAQADEAERALGLPLVLKTRRDGYDGKGQAWVRSAGQAQGAFADIGSRPAVAEAGIVFEAEFSVIVARALDGTTRCFDAPRNVHRDGILRQSILPAGPLIEAQVEEARAVAARLVEALDHVGVLTVEFFASADGPLVNEFAPRVHNSGHWTIEGAYTSQFEQHLRCILGLPLGRADRLVDALVMDNLIGDDVDQWAGVLAEPGAHLHLYRKGEARPGRKMGHVTRLGAVASQS